MLRGTTTAAVLVAASALVAGCGSAGWQASANQIGRGWGDAHPAIVRSEAVELVNGTQAEIIQLRGHFRLTPTCTPVMPPAHRRCPGVVHLDTVIGAVDAHTHAFIESGNDNTAMQLAAFARATRARPLFSIFPEFSSPLVRCEIPSLHGSTIPGTCTTNVVGRRTTSWPIAVALLEHWPLAGAKNRPFSGGWIVTVARSGRILSVRRTGDLPPQLWR